MCGSSSSLGSPSELNTSSNYTAQPQLVYQNGQWVPGTTTGATNPAGGNVPSVGPWQTSVQPSTPAAAPSPALDPANILAGVAKATQAPTGVQPQTMAGQGNMPVTPAGQPGGGNNSIAMLIKALLAKGA